MIFGRMVYLPQWFIWRLTYNGKKYEKKPCALDGSPYNVDASLPENQHSYQAASAALSHLWSIHPPGGELTYALGFWMREDNGLWFLDMDSAVIDGVINPVAQQLLERFPGALVEYSSSRKGLHVIGSGQVVAHRTKPPKEIKQAIAPLELEFYNSGRGIAFGFDLQHAAGSADVVHDTSALLTEYFPPDVIGSGTDTRRPEWRGPEDDDELIAKFMRSNQSAGSAFGGKATIQQLWNGEVELGNEADMALAAHLAFWTGCDGDRIERLMRRSGLVRDKWEEHRTYLRELTIKRACAGCQRVYVEPAANPLMLPVLADSTAPATPVTTLTAQHSAVVGSLIEKIAAAGTFEEIIEEIIPLVQNSGVPRIYIPRLAESINRKLDFFSSKMPIGQLRNLLAPPVSASAVSTEVPEWMQQHCFIKRSDTFYNLASGSEGTVLSFNAEWSRMMPFKPNSTKREVPSEWAFNRWNIVVVDDKMYNPLEGPYFNWGGKEYVNTYRPDSVPMIEAYTDDVVRMIDRFNTHLLLLCNGRTDVYWKLLKWLAHNVQKPGRKIRWSPLIKGVPGDGKSIIGDVMRAAMGVENVKITSTSVLKNTGGFTDWMTGRAVNIIEEIRLHGSARYELFEAMKNAIDLLYVNINAKGKKDYEHPNITNHAALTNFNDGMPIDESDRRWMVIISPNSDIMDAVRARGLSSPADLPGYFSGIGQSCRAHPGQWRQWLMGIDLADFDPDSRAPVTEERANMIASSRDGAEELIAQIIEEGGVGISKDAFCSGILNAQVRMRAIQEGIEIPKTSAWNQILARMGYEKLPKPISFNGSTQRVWAISRIARHPEMVRNALSH